MIDVMSDSTLNERVAEEIRVMIARRNINATELARRAGMTQRSISRRITGEKAIDMDDLEKIAKALEVEITDLLPTPARRDERTSGRINERSRPRAARTRAELLHARPPVGRTAHDGNPEPVKSTRRGRHSARPAWTCDGVTA